MGNSPPNQDSQGLYYIIPAKLAESGDEIKAILYGLISSLARAEGYCWASNQFMAEKLRITDRTIQNKLKVLEDEGWILRTFENDETKEGRKLWPQVTAKALGYESGNTPHETRNTPPRKATDSPPRTHVRHSNINKLSNIKEDMLQAEPAEQKQRDLSDPEKVIEVFYKTINPTINWGNKTTRAAAEFLVKKYGVERVIKMAEYACEIQTGQDQFAPVITTPYQLKEKLPQLFRHANQNQNRQGRGERMQAI